MTDIRELVRRSQFGESEQLTAGLHTTIVQETFGRPPELVAALGNGIPSPVDDGGPVLATAMVPSISLPHNWRSANPDYANNLVQFMQQGGWEGEQIATLYPGMIANAQADNLEDMVRQFDIPSILQYLWADPATQELIEMVRTDSQAGARHMATPRRIVVVTPPEGGLSVIIPPVLMRRLLERYDEIIEMTANTKGLVMHVGYGELVNGELVEAGGLNVYQATNMAPTTHCVIQDAIAPLSGVRDTRVRMRFNDHMLMFPKRKGGAMYNGISYRLYRAFIESFGVEDGMNDFEMAAMYTMMQGSYAGGFKSIEDSPMSYTRMEWSDSMFNQIVGAFFRDLGSPDPRQLTPQELLLYITYAVTAAQARQMAPPFLVECQMLGPDIANASARGTIRANLINSLNPDETNAGTSVPWFLPPRTCLGSMPGSRTQRWFPTMMYQSTPYDPNNRNTFNLYHPDRQPLPHPADLGVLQVINSNPMVPVPALGMSLEQGEDALPEADQRITRYRVVLDSNNPTRTFIQHGHQYVSIEFPTSRNNLVMSRRNLAMSPLSHRANQPPEAFYQNAAHLLPDVRYNADADWARPQRVNSFAATADDPESQNGVEFIRYSGRPMNRRSANIPVIPTEGALASDDPTIQARAIMQAQESVVADVPQDFANAAELVDALNEEYDMEGPEPLDAAANIAQLVAEAVEAEIEAAAEGEGGA